MVCEGIKLNIFIGSRVGTFKHIRYNDASKKKRKDTVRQLRDIQSIQKGEGITCMTFRDPEETEVLIGKENRIIENYNLLNDQYTEKYLVDFGEGKLHSLSVYEDTFIGAVQSGVVKVWKSKMVNELQLNVGSDLERMRHCSDNYRFIATGGKENDLKIWDLEKQATIFAAKNVPHDWLQLRVPIWISDICFIPNTDGKQMAISSKYGFVRLYDTRTQRRPVCSIDFQGQANTCISTGFRERQVLVGTGRGILQMVDLRNSGKPDKSYKGATGAITSGLCLTDKDLIVSISLDRHLRIHKADAKELIHKQYMTTKLTSLLIRSSGKTPLPHELLEGDVEVKNEDIKEENDIMLEDKSDSEFDEIFNNMEVIGDESDGKRKSKKKHKQTINIEQNQAEISCAMTKTSKKSKKHKLKNTSDVVDSESVIESHKKKRKKELSDGTGDSQNLLKEQNISGEPPLDESIKKLLKSTEKRKRELQKKKIEKKRKSVFNC